MSVCACVCVCVCVWGGGCLEEWGCLGHGPQWDTAILSYLY